MNPCAPYHVSFLWATILPAVFLLTFPMVQGGTFPSTEYNALEDLYVSTNGPSWTYDNETGVNNGTMWDFTDPSINPCTSGWSGVVCNTACLDDAGIECHVLGIRLANYNLVGTISTELAALSYLEAMTMSHNSLQSTIPSYLGTMTALQLLSLTHNQLHGSIPSSLCSLCSANLSSLLLGSNSLSQSMPYCLVNSNSSLNVLDLSDNLLDGLFLSTSNTPSPPPPADIHGASIYDLYQYARGRNAFIHSIQYFDLSDNYFTGFIPTVINQWTSLQYFNISYNELQGPMVISTNLSTLVAYDIQSNQISGSLSFDLSLMTNLYEFFAADNVLTGTLEPFSKLLPDTNYSFYTFDLSGNYLSGSLPTKFGAMSLLNTLLLSNNDLTGSLSGVFQPDTQFSLNVIDFNDNAFTGAIPEDIWSLPYVGSVSLAKNCLHGTIPSSICKAKYLQTLDMDGLGASTACRRSNHALDQLSELMHTAPIYNTMYIDGGIPECILQTLPYLNSLYLSGNGLSCSIPDIATGGFAEWGTNSSYLNVLTLSNNRLYGAIPLSLQTSQAIQYLDLSHNRLSGTIQHMNYTATMVEMETPNPNTNKHYLGLKANRLSGPIPDFMQYVGIHIDVLSGNMFSCGDFTSLPKRDSEYDHYWCGSFQLTTSWLNLVTVVAVSVLLLIIVSLTIRYCRCCFGSGSMGSFDDQNGRFQRSLKDLTSGKSTISCAGVCSVVYVALFETVPATVVRITRKLLQFPPHGNAQRTTETLSSSEETVGVDKNYDSTAEHADGMGATDGNAGGSSTSCNNFNTQVTQPAADSKYDTSKIHKDIVNVLYLFVYMRRFAVLMTVIGFVVMLPAYLIIKHADSNDNGNGSTHVYQYGWMPSLAYIGGTNEGTGLLVLWSLLMLVVAILCLVMEKARADNGLISTPLPTVSSISATLSALSTSDQVYYVIVKFYLLFFIVVNCTAMVLINALYVYVNVTQSPLVGAISLYVLVLFKSFWNVKVVPAMLRSRPTSWTTYFTRCKTMCTTDMLWTCLCCCGCCECCECCGLRQRCCPRKEKPQSHYTDLYASSQTSIQGQSIRSATTQCMLLIFNNVLAPAIAVFFSDSSCISQLFRPPAPIESSFIYPKCESFEMMASNEYPHCTSYLTVAVETTFNPPFVYSYQCGSALLTNYVPVFLLMYGVSGILVPCVQWLAVILLQHYWYKEMCETVGRRLSLDGLPVLNLGDFIRRVSTRLSGEAEEAGDDISENEEGGDGRDIASSLLGSPSLTAGNSKGEVGYATGDCARAGKPVSSSLFRMSSQHSDSTDMLRAVPSDDHDHDDDNGGHHSDSHNDGNGMWAPRMSEMSNFSSYSEMEDYEKQLAETRNKKIKRHQSLAVIFTIGVISAMHFPILSCPDIAVLTDPKYPNNRYRIQNTTCSCIAGIGVLLSFGMAYPPLGLVVCVFVCTQTYLLQSLITSHLTTCAEHQQLAHLQMLQYQAAVEASTQQTASAVQAQAQTQTQVRTEAQAQALLDANNNTSSVSAGVIPGAVSSHHLPNRSLQSFAASAGASVSGVSGLTGHSMSSRSEPSKLHLRYENNWYVALTAILRKECQGLSSLLYKCSLWMTQFSGLFVALFLFDITMVPGHSIVVVCVAAALSGLIVSCRSWYKQYSFVRRQKRELIKHASYQDYRESVRQSRDSHNNNDGHGHDGDGNGDGNGSGPGSVLRNCRRGCAMMSDYLHYCYTNYVYYYLFCGCFFQSSNTSPTVAQLMAQEEEEAAAALLFKNRTLAPLIDPSSMSTHENSNSIGLSGNLVPNSTTGSRSHMLHTHMEHADTFETIHV